MKLFMEQIYKIVLLYFSMMFCIFFILSTFTEGAPSQSGQWKYWITLIIPNIFRKVFFLSSLPFYNLSQLIFENNIDEVAAVIGETKASSFFGIFHHIDQLFYDLWLIGINFALQKSPQKEVRWSQIRGSWWTVNIPGRVVLKKSDIDWPPRFPDLIPPKFFFSGFLKSKVYANKSNMAAISPETLANVMENAKKKLAFFSPITAVT